MIMVSDVRLILQSIWDARVGFSFTLEADHRLADVYNPFTGEGYNPLVKDMPWQNCVEHLKLKDEYGDVK